MWNLFKVKNKDTKTASFWDLHCEQISHIVLVLPLLLWTGKCQLGLLHFTEKIFHRQWRKFGPMENTFQYNFFTAWKVSVFGVFLVRTFPHSNWIWRDISPYSVRMRKNADQKNSKYGHFPRSVCRTVRTVNFNSHVKDCDINRWYVIGCSINN